MISGQHRFGQRIDAFGDAYYAERDFRQNTQLFGLPNDEEGGSKSYAVSAGLGFAFLDGWRIELVGNHAKVKELREGVTAGTPFSLDNNSRFLSGDVKADGPLFSAPGGVARSSLGIATRREEFTNSLDIDFRRTVRSAYAEVLIPLVGSLNATPWARRVDVSVAGRYDDYGSDGTSSNPKLGLLWSPITGLNIRSTYATSFRVPPLAQLAPSIIYQVVSIPDADALDGETVTLLPAEPGNPQLKPEESDSFTLGFDFRPPSVENLTISLTYFHIDYDHRIQRPPGLTGLFEIFSDPLRQQVQPFVNFQPALSDVERIFNDPSLVVIDSTGRPSPVTAADIEALYNATLQNIATSEVRGIDFLIQAAFASSFGQLEPFIAGSKLLTLDSQNASTTPVISEVDTVYNPVDLRVRAGLNWTRGPVSSGLALNYVDDYQNNLVSPIEKIDSWTTLDWQLSYHVDSASRGPLSGFYLALDVQNITNERPPRVSPTSPFGDLAFDATNASPRGRFIGLHLRKRW